MQCMMSLYHINSVFTKNKDKNIVSMSTPYYPYMMFNSSTTDYQKFTHKCATSKIGSLNKSWANINGSLRE